VKSKKKEARVELIKKEDFIDIIGERTGIDLNQIADGLLVEILSSLLQLDAKYSDVYQLKNAQQLLEEVFTRYQREEQDRKVLEEFY